MLRKVVVLVVVGMVCVVRMYMHVIEFPVSPCLSIVPICLFIAAVLYSLLYTFLESCAVLFVEICAPYHFFVRAFQVGDGHHCTYYKLPGFCKILSCV